MPNIIYLVENAVNSKIYIGKTINSVEHRWSEHVGTARRGSPFYFHNAIRKYGADAFVMRVLETVDDPGVLNDREIHWIATLNPDYNMTAGGEGTPGHKHSDATKQKLRDANTGLTRSDATRQKISAAKTGVKHSAEARAKMSAAKTGTKHSAETRANMSASRTGRKHSAETRAKMSASRTGRKLSTEHRQKLRDAWKLRRRR